VEEVVRVVAVVPVAVAVQLVEVINQLGPNPALAAVAGRVTNV